jgi:hypothetical protein
MGMDTHSRTGILGGASLLRSRVLTLTVDVGKNIEDFNCPDVTGVKFDYFGKPLIKGKILPGPFQDLKSGRVDYALWPVTRKKQ